MIRGQPLGFEPESGGGTVCLLSEVAAKQGYGSVPRVEVKHIVCLSPFVDPKLLWQEEPAIDRITCGSGRSGHLAGAPPAQADGWQHCLQGIGAEILLFFLPLPQGAVLPRAGVSPLQLRAIAAAVLRSGNALRAVVTCEVCFSSRSKKSWSVTGKAYSLEQQPVP